MRTYTVELEACVTGVDEAVDAVEGGADRLELCVALDVGGLTPSAELAAEVVHRVPVPVFCMVRLRDGDVAEPGDVTRMEREIETMRVAGAGGIVLGLLDPRHRIDGAALGALVAAAAPLPVTFHRAFDQAVDPFRALEALQRAGAARVLTGGGPSTAFKGRRTLRKLVDRAEADIVVVAAGRVRADHVRRLVKETGVREVHARASAFPALAKAVAWG